MSKGSRDFYLLAEDGGKIIQEYSHKGRIVIDNSLNPAKWVRR